MVSIDAGRRLAAISLGVVGPSVVIIRDVSDGIIHE
jgi:hypothetical protein